VRGRDGSRAIRFDKKFWQHNFKEVVHRNDKHRTATPSGLCVARIIDASTSGFSLLPAAGGPLKGRGQDHHCVSEVVVGFAAWARAQFNIPPWQSNVKWRVVWSRRTGTRNLEKHEPAFLSNLEQSLGEQYLIKAVDFGALDFDEALVAVNECDVLVGVHGAGMVTVPLRL
jgi:hypothetical protein